jgi:hypothetical protein
MSFHNKKRAALKRLLFFIRYDEVRNESGSERVCPMYCTWLSLKKAGHYVPGTDLMA